MHPPIRNSLVGMSTAFGVTRMGRSAFYAAAQRGLMVTPIKVGPRAAAVPASELEAINAARIRGASETEIRALVQRLHAARQSAA